jgi:hypothetical protein
MPPLILKQITMAKDPAFLFYSNDFISGTFTMTNEQVGKYIRLLCLQHQKGTLSEKDMLMICGSYDEDIFSKFEKSNNVYYNIRLKEEADKRKAFSESRRNNRLKSKLHITKQETYVQHMENENENENINDNELSSHWQNWKDYKATQHKFRFKSNKSEQVAIKNLLNLANGKTDIAIAIINQSISNGWKGFFAVKSTKPVNEERYDARKEYANRHNS